MRPSPSSAVRSSALVVSSVLALAALAVSCASSKPPGSGPGGTGGGDDPGKGDPPVETLPEENQPAGPSRAELVAKFTADCHASFEVSPDGEWGGEPGTDLKPECAQEVFYQDCSGGWYQADPTNCEGALTTCRGTCVSGCGGCQDACGSGCDGCKAACKAGDQACVTRCAEARADCRDGCVEASKTCRYEQCGEQYGACISIPSTVESDCDEKACDGFAKCMKGGSDAKCAPKFSGLSDMCRDACKANGWAVARDFRKQQDEIDERVQYGDMASWVMEPNEELAAACTPAAKCPAGYAKVVNFLAAFCGDEFYRPVVESLVEAAEKKQIDKRGVELIFNMYGAFYGYTFTVKPELNAFYYGGGAWLPESCRPLVKSFKKERDMGGKWMRARDAVKKVWRTLK